MPAKVKGVKKKKAKVDVLPKGPEVEHVLIDVSNAEWKSMRLTLPLTTEARIATIVVALQKFHHVGIKGLRLHLGESVDGTLIDTGANPTLKELGIRGSSQLFDKARASITYDYPPFRSALNLPVHTTLV